MLWPNNFLKIRCTLLSCCLFMPVNLCTTTIILQLFSDLETASIIQNFQFFHIIIWRDNLVNSEEFVMATTKFTVGGGDRLVLIWNQSNHASLIPSNLILKSIQFKSVQFLRFIPSLLGPSTNPVWKNSIDPNVAIKPVLNQISILSFS